MWNYGLGMTYIVVPLYAQSCGLSGIEIGLLFSIPVFFQVVFNLVGGAYTDRFGGRRIMLISCWLVAAGGVGFIFAAQFWTLFICQVLMVLSRAAFWPATWALASELPGERGKQMGRLNALTNVGQITGTTAAGFILAGLGYTASFITLACMGVLGYVCGVRSHEAKRKAHTPGTSVFAPYTSLLRRRVIYYAVMCAYLSALPFSLSMSFYPLLFKDFGFSPETSGLFLALRAAGSIGAGLIAARFVQSGPRSLSPVVAGMSVACAVGLIPAINHAAPIALSMVLVGLGSGVMTLYFQITMSEVTDLTERGSALALGGLGWGLSHFTTPLALGWISDHYGMIPGFYCIGAFALLWTGVIALLRPWAFMHTKLAN